MKFRTRAAAAAIALPMILGVAACGDKDTAGGGATQPAPTQTTTSAPETSSTPEPSTPAPPTAEEPARLTNASFIPAMKSGTAKVKSLKSSTVMMVSGKKTTITASQSLSPVAMKMDMVDPTTGAMQMIVLKSTMYLSIPKETGAGKYIQLNLKNSKDPIVAQFGSMLDGADPMKSYQGWEKGLLGVKFIKSETIGGRQLDRYDVTVDAAKALQAKGEQVPKGMPKTIVYSVWMGSDKLFYRVTFSMGPVDMVMTISDYNKPVSITAPPANKIVAKR